MVTGQCQCGAITYEVEGEPQHSALCHCRDCTRSAGAPVVAWTLFPADKVTISGEPKTYQSSDHATRHFCGTCGTGLFYTSTAVFQGMIDIRTSTLDDLDAFPPTAHIQVAEAPDWFESAHELPKFERYPG